MDGYIEKSAADWLENFSEISVAQTIYRTRIYTRGTIIQTNFTFSV